MSQDLTVTRNVGKSRFEIDLGDGEFALIEYSIAGKNIIYTHTEVPEAYEGQGIASKMAHEAMEFAKNNDYKVQALCPFVKKYVMEHPEYQDITWGFGKK